MCDNRKENKDRDELYLFFDHYILNNVILSSSEEENNSKTRDDNVVDMEFSNVAISHEI